MAHVNGCHCVHDLDDRGVEGFRVVVSRTAFVDGKEVKIERGPFFEMKMAYQYAHAWKDIDHPPNMPEVKTAQQIEEENKPFGETK